MPDPMSDQGAANSPEATANLMALGQMAGKLAHDFRNLLAVILGNAELLEEIVGDDAQTARMLQLIRTAGERGHAMAVEVLEQATDVPASTPPFPADAETIAANVKASLQRVGTTAPALKLDAGAVNLDELDPQRLEAALLHLALAMAPAMPRGRIVLTLEPE